MKRHITKYNIHPASQILLYTPEGLNVFHVQYLKYWENTTKIIILLCNTDNFNLSYLLWDHYMINIKYWNMSSIKLGNILSIWLIILYVHMKKSIMNFFSISALSKNANVNEVKQILLKCPQNCQKYRLLCSQLQVCSESHKWNHPSLSPLKLPLF